MSDQTEEPKKRFKQHWILWWKVDRAEIDYQVENYSTVSLKSARVIASMLILASNAVTILFISFLKAPVSGLVDVIVATILSGFVYYGKRWAMIAAMVMWTVEKLLSIIDAPKTAVTQIIFWCLLMHALYVSAVVEQRRRKPTKREAYRPLEFSDP